MTSWTELVVSQYGDTDRVAVIDADNRWTGRRFVRKCSGAAQWLTAIGAPEGVAVPALVGNSSASLALLVGGSAIDRPLSPISPRSTAHEVLACAQAMSAPVLIAERSAAELAEAIISVTGARIAWVEDLPESDIPLPGRQKPDDVAAVLHTSGTTGVPKRVEIRHRPLINRVLCNSGLLSLDTTSVLASASGFHHIGGVGNLAVALGVGATVACFPRFTVEAWQGLPDLGVTHVQTVSSMLEILLANDAMHIPGLKILLHGGSPIRPETLRRSVSALPDTDFVELFGQTEGSPITCLKPEDHRRAVSGPEHEHLLESVGRPAPQTELKFVNVDLDGVGEIWARGPHLFLTDVNGWQHTGDLARQDEEGYVYLVGRHGDKIIRGGENIYPVEVENVVIQHPDVTDVAIIGIPDDRLGEIVRAYVVADDSGDTPDAQVLRAFVRERLAGYKVPAEWVFLPELPRNQNGKVLRRVLADL